MCAVFLVDVSDSMSDDALVEARRRMGAALAVLGKEDVAKLVTFAKRPRSVTLEGRTAPELTRHGPGFGQRHQHRAAALELAYGLYPEGYLRRAVVLSDGVETDGDFLAEASRARGFGVEIDVYPSRQPVPGEVAIRQLRAPDHVREEEPFDLRADVFSTVAQPVTLSLKQGDVVNGLDGVKNVDLRAGENEIAFKSKGAVPGDVTYTLEVTRFARDHFAENNRATAVTTVLGMPVVLYVDGDASREGPFAASLTAQQFNVDTFDPLPTTLREAERFDFIVLSDMPAERVSLAQQATLEQYVRDLGGGFLFAGGQSGYALGGWPHGRRADSSRAHGFGQAQR